MTREEAKRRVECCRDFLAANYSDMGEPNFTALNMAIEALSEPTKTDILSDIADLKKSPWFTFGENSLNPISREQYLARKEAVEVIEDLCIKRIDYAPTTIKTDGYSLAEVVEALKRHGLMAVDDSEPTRPKAKWIDHIDSFSSWVECSECGSERAYHTKFCPDCGAEMESE